MACHLEEFRKRFGFSIQEIANKIGTPPLVLVKAELYGERPGPELEEKIAQAIGLRVDLIFQDDKPQAERTVLPLHIG